ncbi:polar amino acid transport system substrate-binding protein [Arthrobacter sp. GAS37]|uniref:substrate-binding periplasmic protein n=1 Tax=Arthrobacter sp. GAS37 TaxID=3156261 RepID=UPI003836E246
MFSRIHKPLRKSALAAIGVVALALTACGGSGAASNNDGLDTITPGKLTVAIEPYMPYTAMKDGQMVGLDAEILQAAAKKLNLTIEPQVTDFNGMLGGVQSRRVDISIGGIAWTKERAKAGLFTDPPYYSPPAMAVKGDQDVKTLADLQGKSLGTVTGYVWVKSIKAVPDAKLSSYPDANGLFADIAAGRVDVGFVDPLLISYTQAQRPDLGLQTKYLTPPTDEEVKKSPDLAYFQPYMTSFYVPKEEPKLEKAISGVIRDMYTNGQLASLIKKYGGDPDQYLKPSLSMTSERQATDRPADWKAPSN